MALTIIMMKTMFWYMILLELILQNFLNVIIRMIGSSAIILASWMKLSLRKGRKSRTILIKKPGVR